jgi:hypothetical protein
MQVQHDGEIELMDSNARASVIGDIDRSLGTVTVCVLVVHRAAGAADMRLNAGRTQAEVARSSDVKKLHPCCREVALNIRVDLTAEPPLRLLQIGLEQDQPLTAGEGEGVSAAVVIELSREKGEAEHVRRAQ